MSDNDNVKRRYVTVEAFIGYDIASERLCNCIFETDLYHNYQAFCTLFCVPLGTDDDGDVFRCHECMVATKQEDEDNENGE